MYRHQNSLWIWVGVAAALSFIGFLLDPKEAERSAADQALDAPLDLVYHVALLIGGVVILRGVWTVAPRAEIIGHLLIGVSIMVTAVSIFTSVGAVASGLILLGIAFANASRIYYLWTVTPRKDPE